jgi:hypothetical protein
MANTEAKAGKSQAPTESTGRKPKEKLAPITFTSVEGEMGWMGGEFPCTSDEMNAAEMLSMEALIEEGVITASGDDEERKKVLVQKQKEELENRSDRSDDFNSYQNIENARVRDKDLTDEERETLTEADRAQIGSLRLAKQEEERRKKLEEIAERTKGEVSVGTRQVSGKAKAGNALSGTSHDTQAALDKSESGKDQKIAEDARTNKKT